MDELELNQLLDDPPAFDVQYTEKGLNACTIQLRNMGRTHEPGLNAAYTCIDKYAQERDEWKEDRLKRKLSTGLSLHTAPSLYKKIAISWSRKDKQINFIGSAFVELVQRLRDDLAGGGFSEDRAIYEWLLAVVAVPAKYRPSPEDFPRKDTTADRSQYARMHADAKRPLLKLSEEQIWVHAKPSDLSGAVVWDTLDVLSKSEGTRVLGTLSVQHSSGKKRLFLTLSRPALLRPEGQASATQTSLDVTSSIGPPELQKLFRQLSQLCTKKNDYGSVSIQVEVEPVEGENELKIMWEEGKATLEVTEGVAVMWKGWKSHLAELERREDARAEHDGREGGHWVVVMEVLEDKGENRRHLFGGNSVLGYCVRVGTVEGETFWWLTSDGLVEQGAEFEEEGEGQEQGLVSESGNSSGSESGSEEDPSSTHVSSPPSSSTSSSPNKRAASASSSVDSSKKKRRAEPGNGDQ